MSAAIFNNATNGLITIRNLLKTGFAPSVGITDDSAAFNASQTTLNPTGGTTTALVKTATITNVDNVTFDATITVTGATEFTGKQIWAVGPCTSNANTAAQGRIVRSLSIGVQSGDVYTIGVRTALSDVS